MLTALLNIAGSLALLAVSALCLLILACVFVAAIVAAGETLR